MVNLSNSVVRRRQTKIASRRSIEADRPATARRPGKLENRFQHCYHSHLMVLADVPRDRPATIIAIDGPRSFRRRLMEMGLVPGTEVIIRNVAPLGDPLEVEVRHGRLSIRKFEAAQIQVQP
jgi:ferrous iron transport protein A